MSSMLRKKEVYTTITPIPGFIPRQLGIDILHSHSEVITLNPLVLGHKPIKAPQSAAADEYYSTWYEIEERVQVIPGIGKIGASKIQFNGCFHDMPWGLQTHTYAPFNIDIRTKYRIGGNQPGYEPPEQREIGLSGLGVPADGLYLREDHEIKCNVTMVSFVKAQLKAATKEMVSRIIKKAELLDSGALHAMIENGKLKTINPADRTSTIPNRMSPLPSPTGTPFRQSGSPFHPSGSPSLPYNVPRPGSVQYAHRPETTYSQGQHSPGHPSPGYPPYAHPQHPQHPQSYYGQPPPQELPAAAPAAAGPAPIEMPGDFYHTQHLPAPSDARQSLPSHNSYSGHNGNGNGNNTDTHSAVSSSGHSRWSASDFHQPSQGHSSFTASSRPASTMTMSSTDGGGSQHRSPELEQKGHFASELATHRETPEEHRSEALKKLDPYGASSQGNNGGQQQQQQRQYQSYSYNPADYAKVPRR